MNIMSQKYRGPFSGSFLSIQLQLKTLLEGAGGDKALELLDALSDLSQSEQDLLLSVFKNTVTKITQGERRLLSEGDLALKEFEERLYSDILEAMRDAADTSAPKLSVVDGGKLQQARPPAEPLQISKLRKSRRLGSKPVLN